DLAQLHLDVCFGRAGGKIIWQPRILCWWSDKEFLGEQRPAPYDRMTYVQMYRHLQCSNRIYEFGRCYCPIEDPQVNVTTRKLNDTDTETRWETPVGTQTAISHHSPYHRSERNVKWPIVDEGDFRVATWRVERTNWRWDQEAYERLAAEWGNIGAPTAYIPRVTVQDLYINTMGVERAIFALYDMPAAVEKYFAALNDCHDRLIDLINESPIEIINFGDNVHSATLSPKLFSRYVLPAYQRRCDRLHAGGKFVHAHWDGDCKPLLPMAKDTGLDGIEAITPLPQGDVTLAEIKAALGDEMVLIDGIPAIYFDETFGEDVLAECTRRIIDMFAPKLVLGISDEISSTGDIERIRLVGRIVDDYNASL
ncbi:hypothetical protein LCGC14_2516880, partial [marine sediment metagenome]